VGARKSPFPITLASGLYNSLYYRTSRDVTNVRRRILNVTLPRCITCHVYYFNVLFRGQMLEHFVPFCPARFYYRCQLLQCVSEKNAPTLKSCSFDKRRLILIIFGQRHQHTFKNDMHIRLSLSHHFTYFICFKIAAIEKRETMCFPW